MIFFSKNKFFAYIFVFFVVFFVMHYSGFGSYADGFLSRSFNPFFGFIYKKTSNIGSSASLFFSKRDLSAENEKLHQSLIDLKIENAKLKNINQENEWLRSEMSFFSDYNYDAIFGHIIGYDLSSPKRHAFIDKGKKDGLKTGMAVTTKQGVIVGTIGSVRSDTAEIIFLTDGNSKIVANVVGEVISPGLLRGFHGLSIKLEMISREAEFAESDSVVTSGVNPNIPAGLLIGSVGSVEEKTDGLWQEAVVNLAINYNDIEMVSVIIPHEYLELHED